MHEIVISRPSHYQILGVDPAASVAEIEQAFARRVSMFTPSAFGNVTQFGIAYQILRDPIKRDRYDRSIGLEPRSRHGLPSIRPGQIMFIAAQHREPDAQAPAPQPDPIERFVPETLPLSLATADTIETDQLYRDIIARRSELAEASDGAVDWKRTGLAVGGLIAAVAAVGAWAGWQAGSEVEGKNLEALSVPLPPAKANDGAVAPSILTVPDDIMEPQSSGRRYAVVRRKPAPRPSDPLAAVPQTQPSEAEPVTGQVSDAAVSPVTEAAASMPLSNGTVASTIERIGYSCGSVESTSAVSGGFKVNCSSGNSYQATKVRGRYRFRRL